MFRIHMSYLKKQKLTFITRSAFQNILHQALITGEDANCFGVLGSNDSSEIQSIQLVRNADVLAQSLKDWEKQNIACIGLFYLHHKDAPDYIYAAMPASYISLSVNLDEKGRLDLLAFLTLDTTATKEQLSLDMIEDGHSVSDE